MAPRVDLETLRKVRVAPQLGSVTALFDPGEALHAALLRCRNNRFEEVPSRVLRRAAGGAQHGAGVELRMDGGVVTAYPVEIVLLYAVIGQCISGHLATARAAGPRWGGQEQRVRATTLAQDVEHVPNSFVDK